MDLKRDVKYVKGAGDRTASLLKKLRILTVADLIGHFPRTYNDYSQVSQIKDITPGPITVKARFKYVRGRYVRRGLHITEALITDDSADLKVVWFNQPYRERATKLGKYYFLSGEYQYQNRRYVLSNPAAELANKFTKSTARIVPIYPETKGLTSTKIRSLIKALLKEIDQIPETLPDEITKKFKLTSYAEAIANIHFPASSEKLELAKARLSFEEVFRMQLASALNKQELTGEQAYQIKLNENLAKEFVNSLDFKLTNAQRKAAWEMLQDLNSSSPMNRLLEGDVGSGKTVVAALGAAMCLNSDKQIAFLAPTDILARQQYQTLTELFDANKVKIELLLGADTATDKTSKKKAIKAGKVDIIVGTHALIQEDVKFAELALAIIDEQHRFGVKQRQQLQQKGQKVPHLLSMTATPIPRSLALTLYSELDVSIIDELPPGRKVTKTEIHSPNSRPQLYKAIDKQIEAGRQVFVICPIIEESDTLGVKSVNKEYDRLNQGVFKHRRVGLLHGKLKSAQKQAVMSDFANGKLDMIVSTTVVEVGVNVLNANVMLIEGAERFGLAQLHQLRGRVGRANHQSYCYVIPTSSAKPSQRLRYFEQTSDGFKLAEYDLELRGPGAIYGQAQHGALDLRIARLTDTKLISDAQKAAQMFIKQSMKTADYPVLDKKVDELRRITNLN